MVGGVDNKNLPTVDCAVLDLGSEFSLNFAASAFPLLLDLITSRLLVLLLIQGLSNLTE